MSGGMTVLVPALLGAGAAASVVAAVAVWRRAGTNPEVFGGRLSKRVQRFLDTGDTDAPGVKPTPQRAIFAGGVLVAVWILSGWPVAGIGCAAAVVALPWLLGSNAVANRRLDRIEALEQWCRGMADRLAGGGGTGLVQTIRE